MPLPPWSRIGLLAAALLVGSVAASAQTLSPETLEAVRRGAESRDVPATGARVPLLGAPELPLVDVMINGRGPYRFLVDLGSNVVIIRRAVADASGMEVLVERDGTDIVRADVVTMGDVAFRNVVMGSYDELDVDGVLGYNILRGDGLAIDYPARALELGAGAFAQDGPYITYEVDGRMPYLPARIGERAILLNLDTGATNWIVFPAAWESWLPLAGPVAEGPILSNNQTGAIRNRIAQLAVDLIVGQHVIHRPVVMLDPEIDDAWLGSAILTGSRVELDTQAQLARIITPAELRAPAYRTVGVSLRRVPGRAFRTISDVIPGTPAAALPLSVGDTILQVGGIDASDLKGMELRAMADDAEVVTLRLLRGGDTLDIPVPVAAIGTHAEVRGREPDDGLLDALAVARARFSAAYRAHDGRAVADFYLDDGRLLPPGRIAVGRAAIERFFTPPPQQEILHHEMRPGILWIGEDMVVEEGRWSMTSRTPASGYVSGAAAYVVAWRKNAAGEWRMALDMWHR